MVILSPSSLVFTFDSCRNSFTIPMTKIIMGGNNYHYRPQRSWGKVIFSEACVKNSVHKGGGVVSQHALQVVSQHALQVSRPTPRGEVEVSGLMGSPGPHLGGLKPTPRGFQAHTQGVLQAHTQGGIPACTEADTPSPKKTANAAGGTHPTGMHSCYYS